MSLRLIAKNFLTYGCLALRGKVAAGFLLLAGPACAGDVTVLAFGDSLTHGYGLEADQGFVPQLQRWLEERDAGATLINGGVSGETTSGGAARIEWSLSEDVDAMILTLGANDMLRGIDPAISRTNLAEILQVAADKDVRVLLVGLKAPGNFGPDYKAEFDAIYPELAARFGVAHAENFFAGLADVEAADWPVYFQPDAIHPNAKGVARIVEALGPQVLDFIAGE